MLTLPSAPLDLPLPTIDWARLSRRFMNDGELEILLALVTSVAPKGVLEFGVNVGRTAQVILEYCPGIERYEGVDVPLGYVTAKKVQRGEVPKVAGELVRNDPRFHLIVRPNGSHDLSIADLSACDAVFIDGDHSRAGVMNDTELAMRVVREDGIVIWHDYHDQGTVDVRDVLHELQAEFPNMPLRHVAGTWIVYCRI